MNPFRIRESLGAVAGTILFDAQPGLIDANELTVALLDQIVVRVAEAGLLAESGGYPDLVNHLTSCADALARNLSDQLDDYFRGFGRPVAPNALPGLVTQLVDTRMMSSRPNPVADLVSLPRLAELVCVFKDQNRVSAELMATTDSSGRMNSLLAWRGTSTKVVLTALIQAAHEYGEAEIRPVGGRSAVLMMDASEVQLCRWFAGCGAVASGFSKSADGSMVPVCDRCRRNLGL